MHKDRLMTILVGIIAVAAGAALLYIAAVQFDIGSLSGGRESSPNSSEPGDSKARGEMDVEHVSRSDHSNVTNQRLEILRSQADLEEIAGEDVAHGIDWERHMAVGVFLGTRNSGGYNVDIERIAQHDNNTATVHAREHIPGDNCVTPMVITEPMAIAVVESSDAQFELELSQTTYSCE